MHDSLYWDLYQKGLTALHEGRLVQAEELLATARTQAPGPGLADRAWCNWAILRIERGRSDDVREGLSRILGCSPDAKARQLAAYNLALLYRLDGRSRPARFYAEVSARLAQEQGDGFSQGTSQHLLGLIEASVGRPRRACEMFEQALGSGFRDSSPALRALAQSVLGYCLALTGERAGALRRLGESLATFEADPLPLYAPALHLNTGFTCLELNDLEGALLHGRQALALVGARPSQDQRGEEKYALYLVGEVLAIQGAEPEAREHFEALQRSYYPQLSDLTELLLALRTHSFLNWLA